MNSPNTIHPARPAAAGLLAAAGVLLLTGAAAQAQQPPTPKPLFCDATKKRALALSGGGFKGAFQAGAAYHLVAHRRCNFDDFVGVSVGSLNAAFLAQAPGAKDSREESLAKLAERAEGLVKTWEDIRSSRQILKPRWWGLLRLGVFKIEYLNNFEPLRKLLRDHINPRALREHGRSVRVGMISFWDGTYREVASTSNFPNDNVELFLDYVFASAMIPVYAKMPQIQEEAKLTDPQVWQQFADGGIRHTTPLAGYFRLCGTPPAPGNTDPAQNDCRANAAAFSSHKSVQQVFVVVTSPFERASDFYPVPAAWAQAPGVRSIRDGHKIFFRALDLALDSQYRWDLNFVLFTNDILRWRQHTYEAATVQMTPEERAVFDRTFAAGNRNFPAETYNPAPGGEWSLPYEIGLVSPKEAYAGTYEVSPDEIARQLLDGCLAADEMMQHEFGMASLAEKCTARFPYPRAPVKEKKK